MAGIYAEAARATVRGICGQTPAGRAAGQLNVAAYEIFGLKITLLREEPTTFPVPFMENSTYGYLGNRDKL